MTTDSDKPIEKKLATFRKILWFIFILASLISLGFCGMYWIFPPSNIAELVLATIMLFAALGIFGAACFMVNHLIEHYIEKEENPFM